MPPDTVKYRLVHADGEITEFSSKSDLLDYISWLVTGYTELSFRIENVKKQNRQFRSIGGTGALKLPSK